MIIVPLKIIVESPQNHPTSRCSPLKLEEGKKKKNEKI